MKVIQKGNSLIIEHNDCVYTIEKGMRYTDKEQNSALCDGFNKISNRWVIHFRGADRGYQISLNELIENYILPSQFTGEKKKPTQLMIGMSSSNQLDRIEAKLDFIIKNVQ